MSLFLCMNLVYAVSKTVADLFCSHPNKNFSIIHLRTRQLVSQSKLTEVNILYYTSVSNIK